LIFTIYFDGRCRSRQVLGLWKEGQGIRRTNNAAQGRHGERCSRNEPGCILEETTSRAHVGRSWWFERQRSQRQKGQRPEVKEEGMMLPAFCSWSPAKQQHVCFFRLQPPTTYLQRTNYGEKCRTEADEVEQHEEKSKNNVTFNGTTLQDSFTVEAESKSARTLANFAAFPPRQHPTPSQASNNASCFITIFLIRPSLIILQYHPHHHEDRYRCLPDRRRCRLCPCCSAEGFLHCAQGVVRKRTRCSTSCKQESLLLAIVYVLFSTAHNSRTFRLTSIRLFIISLCTITVGLLR